MKVDGKPHIPATFLPEKQISIHMKQEFGWALDPIRTFWGSSYKHGYMTFKRTYDRWGLKDGEGKLRIGTSGGE
jgi:hypothetical protein